MYYGASDLAALGWMIQIASELLAADPSNTALSTALSTLRSRLQTRLNARLTTNPAKSSSLVYDTTWGGLIGYGDASLNREQNFGNRLYNDHHYHCESWTGSVWVTACGLLAQRHQGPDLSVESATRNPDQEIRVHLIPVRGRWLPGLRLRLPGSPGQRLAGQCAAVRHGSGARLRQS